MKPTAKPCRCTRGIPARITVLISLMALALTFASCIGGDDIHIPADSTYADTADGTETAGESTAEIGTGTVPSETSATSLQTEDTTVHVHEFVLSQKTEPTCTEIGVGTYICTCGETRGEGIADMLGHDINASTCTAGAFCRRCGASFGSPLGHIYGEWQTYIAAGCETRGEDRTTCSRCGETVQRETAPLGHSFADGRCKYCGMVDPEFGLLDFKLNDNAAGYTVIGIGNVISANITVPATHNGLPVVGIGDAAFKNNQNIRTITLPDGLIEIGNHAFFGCSALESADLPAVLTYIGMGAFANCTSLTGISLPDSLTDIGTDLFTGCTSLSSVNIGGGLTYISECMFADCKALVSVELPRQVTSVNRGAFEGCRSLRFLTLSKNMTKLHASAFSGARLLTEIHYSGTVAEWETLTAGQHYQIGTEMTVYCKDGQTVLTPTIPEE